MPEGDNVRKVARRMGAGLVGRTITTADFRVPRLATCDLAGRQVLAFDSWGKHLLTRFSGGLTLLSHLGMDGGWQLGGPGTVLPRSFDDEVRLVDEESFGPRDRRLRREAGYVHGRPRA